MPTRPLSLRHRISTATDLGTAAKPFPKDRPACDAQPMHITVVEDNWRVVRHRAADWRRDDGRLVLLNDQGDEVMVYLPGEWRSVGRMQWAEEGTDPG